MATVHALHPTKTAIKTPVYGLKAHPQKLRRYALHLLSLIEDNFADQPIFTREDCLHIAFLNVATTTRYGYVCECVRWLHEHKYLHIFSNRVDLALPANKSATYQPLDASYMQTVARLISELDMEQFELNDVLLTWKSDQLLTTGTKRTVLRGCLQRLVRAGSLFKIDDFTYSLQPSDNKTRRRR
jgi:hypothetical protein